MTYAQASAISDLNDFTEHRFGLGPLEDDYTLTKDRRLIKRALRIAAKNFDVSAVRDTLGV